jgi:hypothetical protein
MLRWIGEPEESMAIYPNILDKSRGDEHAVGSGDADEDLGLSVPSRVGPSKDELVDLLTGRPGWRLETSLTPGVPPIWCFRSGGKIEISVAVDRNSIQLYVQDTGAEIMFKHTDELTAWLSTNRPAALQNPSSPSTLGARIRKFGEWD